ncbi:MAG: biotin/lipoyl-binding protein [Candidatus Aminicenantes bacterium]|nr:biotin/lipoyl-binding protein [Candidatus Aminicenantes bacterium]
MKKICTFLFTTIFIFAVVSGTFLSGQDSADQGQEGFVDFLVKNKEILNYESFGTFEHEDWIEVRVYCSDESRKKIEENLSVFNYKDYNYKSTNTGTGTLFVVFTKSVSDVKTTPVVKGPEKKKKCPRKVFVEFEKIGMKSFNEYKYFEKGLTDGGVSPLVSRISGEVAKVFFNPGDKVEKGDVLLNFDVSKLEVQISEAETSLGEWRTNLRKRRQWKVRSARAELQAENKVKEFETELERLKTLKGNNVLVAEKTGQIISVIASGIVLAENDEVAKVLDNSVMKMIVSGEDAALLSGLESLSVKFDGVDEIMTGKVEKVDGKVVASFDNNDLRLSSKSIAKFKVLLKAYDSVVVLNRSKVKKDESGDYVFLIQKKRAKKIYVQTGPVEDDFVVILSGLNENDDLITTDDECLYDGKKLKFTPPAVKKKVVKKAKKVIEKREEPARKIEKREETPVIANEVKYMEKKEWSDFDNCPNTLKVKTRIMKQGSFFGYETFDSIISSGAVEIISSEIEGSIAVVNAVEGSEVSRGQLLITLDIEDMKNKLDNARSSLEEWKKLLTSIESWTDRSENLENELKEKIRKISLLIPKLGNMISNANIYSPVDGVITYIVNSGDVVKEGGILAKIEDNARVYIPVNVDDVSKYNEDMKVETAFEGIAGSFPGKLKISDGRMIVIVDNFSKALSAGMKAKINIMREYSDVIVSNKSEILRDSDGYYGFIVEKNRAKRVALTAGADKGSKIIILSGLKAGDELIISRFDCLEDGKKIKVKYFDAVAGKYVIKRTAKDREDIAGRLFEKKVAAGLGIGMYMVSDEVFTNVYGSGVISGVFDISFNVFNRVELFTNVWYIPKAGSSEAISKVDLSMFSFYIGAKYLVNWTGKFLPYIGVALNSLAVKETSEELDLATSYRTSIGFSGIGGFYFKLKENMNLKFDIRYDLNKMEIEEFESELDFSGVKIALGIVLRF